MHNTEIQILTYCVIYACLNFKNINKSLVVLCDVLAMLTLGVHR